MMGKVIDKGNLAACTRKLLRQGMQYLDLLHGPRAYIDPRDVLRKVQPRIEVANVFQWFCRTYAKVNFVRVFLDCVNDHRETRAD
jgi:hypothetical protein